MPEVSSLLSSGNVPREKEGLPRPCFEGVVLWTKGKLNSKKGKSGEWHGGYPPFFKPLGSKTFGKQRLLEEFQTQMPSGTWGRFD